MNKITKKWGIFLVFIITSAFIKAVVTSLLLHPLGMLPAGTTGVSVLLALIVKEYLHLPDFGYWTYFAIINLPLAIWAYKKVNKMVVVKTIVYIVVFTFVSKFVDFLVNNYHITFSHDHFLVTLLAGIGIGTHISLMLYIGGTTGGVDLLGMYVSKKLNSDAVGKINNINNLIIFTIVSILKNQSEIGILSFITSFLASMVVEKYHMQSNFILLMIVSKHKNSVNKYITEKLQRTNVIMKSQRGYDLESDNTMFITLPKYRLRQVISNVKTIDPDANLLSIPIERVHHKVRSSVGESMI